MQISLLCIGATDEQEIVSLMQKYEKRLPAHFNFERVELQDIKNRKNRSEIEQKDLEAKMLLDKIKPTDHVILLDEKGKTFASIEFANLLNQLFIASVSHIVFVVGGPYGFGAEMKKRANQTMSLSAMTFTHQMVRLFFVEQLYRAYTILDGKPYHHV
ncbi:MAG: 23S rRNA (pseudouridine(1915)-N(3))-methyltransferase RlmH [Weeksellaceae bacterium]|nr:23S rRNA (pseudouridine(1915)-N(3))-methyltransferase RlmH [Weeksellaceae bacterium]